MTYDESYSRFLDRLSTIRARLRDLHYPSLASLPYGNESTLRDDVLRVASIALSVPPTSWQRRRCIDRRDGEVYSVIGYEDYASGTHAVYRAAGATSGTATVHLDWLISVPVWRHFSATVFEVLRRVYAELDGMEKRGAETDSTKTATENGGGKNDSDNGGALDGPDNGDSRHGRGNAPGGVREFADRLEAGTETGGGERDESVRGSERVEIQRKGGKQMTEARTPVYWQTVREAAPQLAHMTDADLVLVTLDGVLPVTELIEQAKTW